MSVTDDLLKNNEEYARGFDKGDLPLPPAKGVAVVACMDARLDVHAMLGLELGDAHVIRNAGGVITDDEIRSLVISQRLLGTTEIILIHHTGCGMLTFTDDEVAGQIEADTGAKEQEDLGVTAGADDAGDARIDNVPAGQERLPGLRPSTEAKRVHFRPSSAPRSSPSNNTSRARLRALVRAPISC